MTADACSVARKYSRWTVASVAALLFHGLCFASDKELNQSERRELLRQYQAKLQALDVQLRAVVVDVEMTRSVHQMMGGKDDLKADSHENVVLLRKDSRYRLIKDSSLQKSRPGEAEVSGATKQRLAFLSDGNSESSAIGVAGEASFRLNALKPAAKEVAGVGPSLRQVRYYALPQISFGDRSIIETIEDSSFRNDRTTEVIVDGRPCYKIFFQFKADTRVDRGWWLVDPARSWALSRFEVNQEMSVQGYRIRSSSTGVVTYRQGPDDVPRPASVEYHQGNRNEKVDRGTAAGDDKSASSSVDNKSILTYSNYALEARPDAEFSLASIGLGYAEVPAGPPRNRSWLFLGLFAIACLTLGIVLKLRLRRRVAA